MPAIKLIVGLGNLGKQYESTRHNAGFWFLDEISKQYNVTLKIENKFLGSVCHIKQTDKDFWLLKPATFMNRSGEAIKALSMFYKILPENILIVHDELDLPTGSVRLKTGGGHGGHNGLRDTITQLGTSKFNRLRIGISHPRENNSKQLDVSNYVLSHPTKIELQNINLAINDAILHIDKLLKGDFATVMQNLHTN